VSGAGQHGGHGQTHVPLPSACFDNVPLGRLVDDALFDVFEPEESGTTVRPGMKGDVDDGVGDIHSGDLDVRYRDPAAAVQDPGRINRKAASIGDGEKKVPMKIHDRPERELEMDLIRRLAAE
jgi:hypothetical protein